MKIGNSLCVWAGVGGVGGGQSSRGTRPGPGSPGHDLEELLELIGEGTEFGGADGVRTGRVSAEALGGRGDGGGARCEGLCLV